MPSDFFAERTPEPVQYLNLMKSIWVVQKIKTGDEYAQSSSDPLWKWYIKELDEVGELLHLLAHLNMTSIDNIVIEMLA